MQNSKSMKPNENQRGCLVDVEDKLQGYVADRCFQNSKEKKEKRGKNGEKKREKEEPKKEQQGKK